MTQEQPKLITITGEGEVIAYNLEDVNNTYLDVTDLDPVVLDNVIELVKRSRVGVHKYGTDLEHNNSDDFLQHAKEEALDFANYLTKMQHKNGRSVFGQEYPKPVK
jgi:hypothetical protein